MTTEGERIFQRGKVLVKYEKSGHYCMSGIYNIGSLWWPFKPGAVVKYLYFSIHIITVPVNTILMSCDLP